MLLKYTVGNFKSIGEAVSFDMLSTMRVNVLRRGIILGANGSGKSCLLESMRFAVGYVLGDEQKVEPFKTSFSKPSTFEFTFWVNDSIYNYGFSLDEFKIHEEWLVEIGKNETKLITRKERLLEIRPDLIPSEPNFIVGMGELFLSKLAKAGIGLAKAILDWFKLIKFVNLPTGQVLPLGDISSLACALKKFDVGITDVKIGPKLEVDLTRDILDSKQGLFIDRDCYFFNKTGLFQLKFVHELDGKHVEFCFKEESKGTQHLIKILPVLLAELERGIYIVDDFDFALHPNIAKRLFAEFPKTGQNQLICTSNYIRALELTDFNKDEIWFAEKSLSGETKLVPFSDYDVREDADHVKSYLGGRFNRY